MRTTSAKPANAPSGSDSTRPGNIDQKQKKKGNQNYWGTNSYYLYNNYSISTPRGEIRGVRERVICLVAIIKNFYKHWLKTYVKATSTIIL